MRLRITQRDIKRGTRGRADSCPIALALKREFPKLDPRVHPYRVFVYQFQDPSQPRTFTRTLKYAAILSKRAQKFIEDFDANRKVQPFTTLLKF
jgi:hypothetical protein